MEHLSAFAPLARRYQGFILDLWGVIHDGVRPYPGAVECLERIRDLGKPAVLLSNAPRRAHAAQAAMRAMGIADDLYAGILTSGEATHIALRDRSDPWFAALGRRMYHLGPARDRNVFDTLDLDLVDRPEDAEFVLNTGPDDLGGPTEVADWEALLQAFRQAKLPMICANPDLEVIRGGVRVICAGALTQRYEAIGGAARWLGKPDPAIYTPVLAMLGTSPGETLAVGDALRTDIAGAKSRDIPSCWVLGGIHEAELGGDPVRIKAAAAAAGLAPVAVLPRFVW
jgi:HAD superfamily hydrolase (TIGR01459 family)